LILDSEAKICAYFDVPMIGAVQELTAMSGDSLRVGGQTLSAIFGGTGIFYLWCSFYVPIFGLKAFIMLGAATAILFLLDPELLPDHRGTVKAIHGLVRRIVAPKGRR
jgi:hypothetical protein